MSFTVRRLKEQPKRTRALRWKAIALAVLGSIGSLTSVYKHSTAKYQEHKRSLRRVMVLKRTLMVLIAVLCALLLLAGTVRVLAEMRIISIDSFASLAGTPPAKDAQGHTNLLLLGQGDSDHDGKDLTDTVMVASLDPEGSKGAVLLSLPRDLYFLRTENMGRGRINSLYRDYKYHLRFRRGMEEAQASKEAMRELAAEIGRQLNLEIHGTVKVDFIGFVEAVEAMGGIEIDVPYDIVDTEYPDENFGYETFEIRKGLQHIDGATALKYVRSRHTTSDFSRSARQQQLLAALGEKAQREGLATDPKRIMSLLSIVRENLETTMSVSELIGIANAARNIDRSNVITMQLNDRNAIYDSFIEPGGFLYTPPRDEFGGASVLLPVSIPEFPVTWKQVQALIELLVRNREIYLAEPQFAVLNASAPSGTARRLGNELIRYGFAVPTIANTPIRNQAASTISARSEADQPLAEFFGALLGMDVVPLPPVAQGNAEQLTIILGSNGRFTPLQNLISMRQ